MYVSVNACTCIDVYSMHFSSKCLALYPVFNIDRYYQEELLILHIEPYTVSNNYINEQIMRKCCIVTFSSLSSFIGTPTWTFTCTFHSSLNVSSASGVKSDDELDFGSENSAAEMNSPGATGGVFVPTAVVDERNVFVDDR